LAYGSNTTLLKSNACPGNFGPFTRYPYKQFSDKFGTSTCQITASSFALSVLKPLSGSKSISAVILPFLKSSSEYSTNVTLVAFCVRSAKFTLSFSNLVAPSGDGCPHVGWPRFNGVSSIGRSCLADDIFFAFLEAGIAAFVADFVFFTFGAAAGEGGGEGEGGGAGEAVATAERTSDSFGWEEVGLTPPPPSAAGLFGSPNFVFLFGGGGSAEYTLFSATVVVVGGGVEDDDDDDDDVPLLPRWFLILKIVFNEEALFG